MLSMFSCAFWSSSCLLWRNVSVDLLPIFLSGCFVCLFVFNIELHGLYVTYFVYKYFLPACGFFLFCLWFPLLCKRLCLIRPHLFIFITLGDGLKMILLDFPGSPVVKTLCFQCLGAQVQSLVMELRFHLLCSAGKKKDIAVIYVKRVFCLCFPLRSFWFFLIYGHTT